MSGNLHIVCPHCSAVNRLPRKRIEQAPHCGQCHAALFSGHPIELAAANFNTHAARNDVPVVVDFWAPWCAPCRMMAPAFESAACELEPHVRLAKVNTEEQPELAAAYRIRGIPTLVMFRAGREIARQSGALSTPQLLNWIRQTAG